MKARHGNLFLFQVELHSAQHFDPVNSRIANTLPFCKRVYAAMGKRCTIIVFSFDDPDGYNRLNRASSRQQRMSESGSRTSTLMPKRSRSKFCSS